MNRHHVGRREPATGVGETVPFPTRSLIRALLLVFGVLSRATGAVGADPATLCYSTQPQPYFDDHAAEVKRIYDGFFFNVGSWEKARARFEGVEGAAPTEASWLGKTRTNLVSLSAAGVTENFLTVALMEDGEWPSPQTLLTDAYSRAMAGEFGALARVAKGTGFRGVCVDVEYPYPRYYVDHKVYTYTNYTVGDLTDAAFRQGYLCAVAMLEEFPEIVVIQLPGYFRGRPIERMFQFGMLKAMAERDAPGGLHLGCEYTYCLHDPITTLATTRFEDPNVPQVTDATSAAYWRRRCSIAPGVWPTHAIETGGKDYPQQSWTDEVAELRRQMAILRAATKRYIWSFSGVPSWYVHTPELESRYGLGRQDLKRPDIDLRDWHRLLAEKPRLQDPLVESPLRAVRRYDVGRLNSEQLCDAFGTPARWWVLGMLGNPHTQPQFAAPEALRRPIDPQIAYHGRDGSVRWFLWENQDPRGVVSCVSVFDHRNTDNSSAHFVSFVRSVGERRALLHTGWDDGILIQLGEQVLFDAREYPKRGKGLLYLDKYQFEKHVPFTLPAGKSQLSVTDINSHGNWLFSLRITDENDVPFPDVTFRAE